MTLRGPQDLERRQMARRKVLIRGTTTTGGLVLQIARCPILALHCKMTALPMGYGSVNQLAFPGEKTIHQKMKNLPERAVRLELSLKAAGNLQRIDRGTHYPPFNEKGEFPGL